MPAFVNVVALWNHVDGHVYVKDLKQPNFSHQWPSVDMRPHRCMGSCRSTKILGRPQQRGGTDQMTSTSLATSAILARLPAAEVILSTTLTAREDGYCLLTVHIGATVVSLSTGKWHMWPQTGWHMVAGTSTTCFQWDMGRIPTLAWHNMMSWNQWYMY